MGIENLVGLSLLALVLSILPREVLSCDAVPVRFDATQAQLIWEGSLANGIGDWGAVRFQFGRQNVEVVALHEGPVGRALRVAYPAGSFDPGSAAKGLAPEGGAQFTVAPAFAGTPIREVAVLSYSLRFSANFDFVRGGKLPGLFGGIPRSGGKIPTGKDGFSTRLVWQIGGEGGVYAYLPTSVQWGTLFGKGAWKFRPGKWIEVTQQIQLNTPGESDGNVAVWVDRDLVFRECGVRFRDVPELTIDGIFFSTFFGGNDRTWATPSDVYVDFSDFKLFVPPERRGARGRR